MHFVYQGFTHDGDIRSFAFQGVDERRAQMMYSIRVSLLLFARHRVAMQDAPAFCLHLLTDASALTPQDLEKFQDYQVREADLGPLLADRAKRELQKAHKSSARRLVHKREDTDARHQSEKQIATAPLGGALKFNDRH